MNVITRYTTLILVALCLFIMPSGCVTQSGFTPPPPQHILAEAPAAVEQVNLYDTPLREYVTEGLFTLADKLLVTDSTPTNSDKSITRFVFGVIVFISKTENVDVMYELSGVVDLHQNGTISSVRAVRYIGEIMKRYPPKGNATVEFMWFIDVRTIPLTLRIK